MIVLQHTCFVFVVCFAARKLDLKKFKFIVRNNDIAAMATNCNLCSNDFRPSVFCRFVWCPLRLCFAICNANSSSGTIQSL
jgi:hypothetical protein